MTDYREAGVDIEAGEKTVELIRQYVKSTYRPGVLGDIGGFGGFFALGKYREPVLVSGTDGVGTKLKLAIEAGIYDGIGRDLVAMCVNDIAVSGAEPLFFLDYFATGKLSPELAAEVVKGIAAGCREAGCALIGGETAEMPGLYAPGDFDLAGFAVGVVEREEIIDGKVIREGDSLVGFASSGPHSNGFSLVRKILGDNSIALKERVPGGGALVDELLAPTRIYVKTVLALKREFSIRGLAHITGGGIVGNLPRVFPEGLAAEIEAGSWPVPAVFGFLEERGGVSREEMYRVFNMGIGLIAVVPREEAAGFIQAAGRNGEKAYSIGKVVRGRGVRICGR